MQVAAASEPGSPDKPNEDGIVVTADMAAILDGATVRTDTGCIHGVPWFVGNPRIVRAGPSSLMVLRIPLRGTRLRRAVDPGDLPAQRA